MSAKEIMEEIERLPLSQKKLLAAQMLKSIRAATARQKMETAVNELIEDYKTDKELTAFTEIDFEDFYETK